jgi:hypothetical protein
MEVRGAKTRMCNTRIFIFLYIFVNKLIFN